MIYPSFNLIQRTEFENWVKSPIFANLLPGFVEDLIRLETGSCLIRLDFATEEDAQKRGYDGVSETSEVRENVPQGITVWELGKEGDARAKAKNEYIRIKAALGKRAKSHTFVFVTPRVFKKRKKDTHLPFNEPTRKDWEDARKQDGDFKDVHVIDLSILLKWAAKHPQAALQLKSRFEPSFKAAGFELPDQTISNYVAGFNDRRIEKDILLCGSENLSRQISEHDAIGSPLTIMASSETQALALACVAYLSIDDLKKQNLRMTNTIVVTAEEALRNFQNAENCTFIITERASAQVHAVQEKNTVIICKSVTSKNIHESTVARDPGGDTLAKYLESRGVENSRQKAEMAGGSLNCLRRQLGGLTEVDPDYFKTKGQEREAILLATLFGAWSEAKYYTENANLSSLDIDAITSILPEGMSYKIFKTHLATHLDRGEEKTAADTLLKRIKDIYWVKAPVDAIDGLLNEFDNEHIEIFERLLIKVFSRDGEVAPDTDKPFDQGRKYSKPLQTGLALTFCILAYRYSETSKSINGQSVRSWAKSVFDRLMQKVDFIDFISDQRGLLGYFAEASPEAFMESLESALQGNQNGIRALLTLEESEYGFSHTNKAASLLWALMTLAWKSEWFEPVVRSLVRLHTLDPDPNANHSPRPITAFYGLYAAFAPQTSVPWEERMSVLGRLPEQLYDDVFELIVSALPSSHGSVFSHSKPVFRNEKREPLTNHDVFHSYNALFRAANDRINNKAERIADIVEHAAHMSDEIFEEIIPNLQKAAKTLDDDGKKIVWKPLRALIVRHKRFPDADWSMADKRLKTLETFRDEIAPTKIDQAEFLFSASYINDLTIGDDYSGNILQERRTEAVKEILHNDNNDIIGFAKRVKESGFVGLVLADAADDWDLFIETLEDALTFPDCLSQFIRGCVQSGYRVFKNRFLDWLFSARTIEGENGQFILMATTLPLSPEITERIKKISVRSELVKDYWEKVGINFWPKGSVTISEIQPLLDCNRHVEVLMAVRLHLNQQSDDVLTALLNGFFESLMTKHKDNVEFSPIGGFLELLKEVHKRQIVDLKTLSQYEFIVAKQLRFNHHAYPYAIHEIATSEAGAFVELLALHYKTTSPHPSQKSSEDEEAIKLNASLAYHVFDTMRHPGLQEGEKIGSEILIKWIAAIRDEAKKYGLVGIANYKIGEVLSQCSADPDDHIWPRKEVREVIEAVADDRMIEGVCIKHYNSRGVFSNGHQFYNDHADKHEEAAKQLDSWPKTKTLLKRIVEHDRHSAQNSYIRDKQYDAMPKL